jgi:hypothetical protein
MTVHMETVYAEDKMSRVSTFPGLHTVPWIVLTLQCLHHGIGRSELYFLWLGEIPQESAKTRRMPVRPPYRIPDSPDISLNDVSFTSMTVHMETVYAADKNVTGFDVSWIPRCHG